MPRPQKEGIDYFPLDVNFFSDPKIKILKARYGMDGITLYIYLLCEIYRAGYYIRYDDDSAYILSDDLKMSSDKVKQVLNFLLERSLFNNILFQSDKVLTSAGIQKRFQLAVKERAKKKQIEVKDFWLLEQSETESFIKVNPSLNNSWNNNDNSGKNTDKSQEEYTKESKEKKSKGNNKKEVMYVQDEKLNQTIIDFIEQREKTGKPMTDRAVSLLIKKLDKLTSNSDEKIEILNQSIVGGWTSIFPLKDTVPDKSTKKNQFHNFKERDTDYDSMILAEMKGEKDGGN